MSHADRPLRVPGEMPSSPPPLPHGAVVAIKPVPKAAPREKPAGEGAPVWFLVVFAVLWLGVGVLLGLTVSALTGGSVSAARQEAEKAREETAAIVAKLQEVQDERDQFQDAALRSAERAEKIKELESLHITNTAAILRSQALLKMVLDSDAVRNLMNRHDVRHKFKPGDANWFWPETAYELIGGRWWLKEMVAKGLIEKRLLDELEAQERKEDEARRK